MQVLCGLQGIFLLFNCQTPEPAIPHVDEYHLWWTLALGNLKFSHLK